MTDARHLWNLLTCIGQIEGDGKSWASDVDKENGKSSSYSRFSRSQPETDASGSYDYLMFADSTSDPLLPRLTSVHLPPQSTTLTRTLPTSSCESCKPPDNHRLRRCRSKWGDWILKETGAYGFRFDAVKHISQEFIAEFVKHIRSKEGGRPKALLCRRILEG